MKRLGILIASTGMTLALGATAVSAADIGIEQRTYREDAYAPRIRERVVIDRPIRERVVVERPVVRERVVVERPVRERVVVVRPIIRERIIRERVIERPVEERVVVKRPVEERVVVRKIAPAAPVAYAEDDPAFVGEWGPGWRYRGWGGGWGRHW